MAGKKQQTFAKLTRERAVKEKRERKAEKKLVAAEERARLRELTPEERAAEERARIREEAANAAPETGESAVLSEEGLAQPVLLALQRTKRQGVAAAETALVEVERRGARAPIVALIVLRLAAQLSGRAAGDLRRLGFELWPPPNGAVL